MKLHNYGRAVPRLPSLKQANTRRRNKNFKKPTPNYRFRFATEATRHHRKLRHLLPLKLDKTQSTIKKLNLITMVTRS